MKDLYKEESSLRPYKVKEDMKKAFAESIQSITDPEVFEGFRSTIDLIKAIISR